MKDFDCLELPDSISWTGAWRFCQGCIGFTLWFCQHPNVDACSLDRVKHRQVLEFFFCRAPVWSSYAFEKVFCTTPG